MSTPTLTPQQLSNFWAKVDKSDADGCWTWTACRDKDGYGRFSLNRKPVLAHRISYHITHGGIPEELCCCHICDHPPCVRPDHLFMGTSKENIADCIRKQRFHFKAGRPFLISGPDCATVARKFSTGVSIADLAKEFGVSAYTIHKAIARHFHRERQAA